MRLLFVFVMVLGGNVLGQSKKDLRLELDKANSKVDSLSKALAETKNNFQKKSDSLQLVIDETQKRLNAQYQFTKTQEESITKCTNRNASLRSENEQLKETLRQTQGKPTTKTKKEATTPFSSGSGNGNTYGTGNDNNEGRNGLGPGNTNRKRLTNVDVSSINSTEKGSITLLLTIDSDGNVIQTSIYKEQSTITNQAILDQVSACVKRDVKYQKAVNAAPMNARLKVYI
jgi:regulator of replication initiation timing